MRRREAASAAPEPALDFPQRSADADFRYPDYLVQDPELATIRESPRFKPLV